MDNSNINSYLDKKCSFCDFFDDEEFKALSELSISSGKVVTILSTAVNGYREEDKARENGDYEQEYETDIVQISMVHIFNGEIYWSTTNFKPSHEIMERTFRTHGVTNDEASTLEPMGEEFSNLINTIFKNHIVMSFNFYDFDYKNIKESKSKKNLLSLAPAEFYDFEKMIKTFEGVEGWLTIDSSFRVIGSKYNGVAADGDFTTAANVIKMVSLANDFFTKHSIDKVMEVYGTPDEKKERMDLIYSNNFTEDERDPLSATVLDMLSKMSFDELLESDLAIDAGLGNVVYRINDMIDCGVINNKNISLDSIKMERIKKSSSEFFNKSFLDYNKVVEKIKSDTEISNIAYKDIYLKMIMLEKNINWPDKKRNVSLKSDCSTDGQSDIEFDVSM